MVDMLPGTDPLISPTLQESFIRHEAASTQADMKARLFAMGVGVGELKGRLGNIESTVQDIAQRLLLGADPNLGSLAGMSTEARGLQPPPTPPAAAAAAAAITQRQQPAGLAPPASPPPAPPSSAPAAPGEPPEPPAGLTHPAGTVLDSEGNPVKPQGAPPLAPMSWSEGRRIAQSGTGMAEFAARAITRRAPEFRQDDEGNLISEQYIFDETEGPRQAYIQRDPSTGAVLNAVPADDPNAEAQVADLDQGASRMRMISHGLSRYAAGEGIAGALGGGVKAGVAGAVVAGVTTAGRSVGNWFAEQNAAAAPYRQAYGEDAGQFAFGQRFDRWATGLGGFFSGIGSERAQQGFDAATRAGLTGERFDAAVEFDTDMYRRFGMSSAQTEQLIALNAQDANYSLDEFAKQIEKVSEAAVDAGKNSQQAVDMMLGVGAQLRSGFSDDPSTSLTAANLTTTALENLPGNLSTPENVSAMAATLTDRNILYNATMAGVDRPMAALTEVYESPDAQAASIEMTLERVVQMVAEGVGHTPESLRAAMDAMFGGKPTTPEERVEVTRRWEMINPMTLRRLGSAYGYQFTPGQEMELFIEHLYGGMDSLHEPGDQEGLINPFSGKRLGGTDPEIIEGGAEDGGLAAANKAMTDPESPFAYSQGGVKSDYREYMERTGNRNTAIERLIRNSSELEEQTGVDFDEIKFDTSQGEKTISEIIGNKDLRGELVEGGITAKAKGGETIGLTDYIGLDPTAREETIFDEGGGFGGRGDPEASPMGWMIDLTPRAMELLELRGPSDSQRAGMPPLGTSNPLSWRR